jgi:predicted oxidoreductase
MIYLSFQACPKKGKLKGVGASANSELTNHVLDEELQKKIAENACLLSMVGEVILEIGYTNNKIHKIPFPFYSY